MNQARDDALPISVISQPLQQLVSDCFEEEQYEIGLNTLRQILSPTIVPDKSLIQQLLVLSVSRSDSHHTGQSKSDVPTSLLHKRRRKSLTTSTSIQLKVSPSAIRDANVILYDLARNPSSANHLLSALPPFDQPAAREITPFARSRRSSSTTDKSDEDISAVSEAASLLVQCAGNVWDVLSKLAAVRGSTTSRWNLLRADAVGSSSKRSSLPASTDPVSILWELAAKGEAVSRPRAQWGQMRELLEAISSYNSARAWRLLEILTTAWRSQRQACGFVSRINRQSHPKDDTGLRSSHNLAMQVLPNAKQKLPYDDVSVALDVVFAGLCPLHLWQEPQVAHKSRHAQMLAYRLADRVRTAAELFHELCCLVSQGVISETAISRGFAERASILAADEFAAFWQTFATSSEEEAQARVGRSIVGEAIERHFGLEHATGETDTESLTHIDDESKVIATRDLLRRLEDFLTMQTSDVRDAHSTVLVSPTLQQLRDLSERVVVAGGGVIAKKSLTDSRNGQVARSMLTEAFNTAKTSCALSRRVEMLCILQDIAQFEGTHVDSVRSRRQSPHGIASALRANALLLKEALAPAVESLAQQLIVILQHSIATRTTSVGLEQVSQHQSSVDPSSAEKFAPVSSDAPPLRPPSGRTSKPPPRMGISKRSRGLGSSSSSSAAFAASTEKKRKQSETRGTLAQDTCEAHKEISGTGPAISHGADKAHDMEEALAGWLLEQAVSDLEATCTRIGLDGLVDTMSKGTMSWALAGDRPALASPQIE